MSVGLPLLVDLLVNLVLRLIWVLAIVHGWRHLLVHWMMNLGLVAARVVALMHGRRCHVLGMVVRFLVDLGRHLLGMHVGSWVILLPLGDVVFLPLNLLVALVIAHLGIGLVRLHLGVPCLLFSSGLLHLHVTRRHVVAVMILGAYDVLVMLWGGSERLAVDGVCSHCFASCADEAF